jgi:hypothetical protein
MRRQLYSAALDEIDAARRNNPQATFGPNRFAVMTTEERLRYFGGGFHPKKASDLREAFPSANIVDISSVNMTNPVLQRSSLNPKSKSTATTRRGNAYGYADYFDWANEGKVLTPLDQGSCGGCWAFASSSLIEVCGQEK